MKRVLTLALAALLAVAAYGDQTDGEDEPQAASLKEALAQGEPVVSFRYRLESVEQDGFDKDALASTLRTTLGYRTKPYKNFSVFLEAEDVTDIGTSDEYDNRGAGDAWNGVEDRPVIADPEGTEMNQAYLRWQNDDSTFTVGREEFNWSDQRFIGNVGWRQNHQTFDGATFLNHSLDKLDVTYQFIDNVNRIFRSNAPMQSHLLSGKIDLPVGAIDLYGLYLDYDEAVEQSTATYGLEWTGTHELEGGAKLLWEAEYADQQDAADNPNAISADYTHLVFGATLSPKLTIKAGWEILSGSPADGQFQTPLATLHKWNGWADKFLSTPDNGLEDLYLALNGKAGELSWIVVLHDFSSESAGIDYGTELDAQLSYKLSWGQTLALKAAQYDADQFATDTTKLWLYTTYQF